MPGVEPHRQSGLERYKGNDMTVAELFIGFFVYYNEFAFDTMAISVYCGRARRRSA